MKVKQIGDARERIVRTPSTNSVDSQSSTLSVHDSRHEKLIPSSASSNQNPATRRHVGKVSVGFAEDQNKYYHDTISAEERECLWYTPKEVARFRRLTAELVRRVMVIDAGKCDSWSFSLQHAYRGFCMADSVAAVEAVILEHSTITVGPSRMGLEKWAVRSMTMDRIQRRREMWASIQEIQQASYSTSRAKKQHELRSVCRTISRPSRMFAHHLAQLSLRQWLE